MNTYARISVTVLALVFALGGMSHGFFETLQGNTPTDGFFIEAIGEEYQTWEHGGEGAFTIIPNFLLTGILALTVSFIIMIWSIDYLHTKHGATVLLLLYIALLLVGGGIGQIPFFLLAWAGATRINKPLTWWRKVLPHGLRRVLSVLWPVFPIVGTIPILLALTIAVFGFVPGMSDADQILGVVFALLGAGLVSFMLSFLAGFSRDIEARPLS